MDNGHVLNEFIYCTCTCTSLLKNYKNIQALNRRLDL